MERENVRDLGTDGGIIKNIRFDFLLRKKLHTYSMEQSPS